MDAVCKNYLMLSSGISWPGITDGSVNISDIWQTVISSLTMFDPPDVKENRRIFLTHQDENFLKFVF